MAYDEVLAQQVRDHIADLADCDEKKMFGGLAFMVNTHMACGCVGSDLMVRVGSDGHDQALARGAREMDFTGRPMRGMVMVEGAALTDDGLARWIRHAVDFALAQPPKPPKPPKR